LNSDRGSELQQKCGPPAAIVSINLRASSPTFLKTFLKTRTALILVSGFKLVYHRRPQKRNGAPSSQINSRRSRAAGPYRERQQLATRWKKSPGPACQAKSPPKNLLLPVLPPFGAAAAGEAAPLSSSPPPAPAQKSSPARPHCRLARLPLPLPTPRVPATHSQATSHPARKVFVRLPRRLLWTAMISS
jgi:hypothetical protein